MTELAREISKLARAAGAPSEDLTILAEGNAAVFDRANDRFLVKASGVIMSDATDEDWVWVSASKCVELLEEAVKVGVTDKLNSALDLLLKDAFTPSGKNRKASIETLVHVVAFHLMDANWSLHTHPTPVVAIAASKRAAEHYSGSLFPDESVICGPVPLFLPYAAPGLELGLGVYQGVLKYKDQFGRSPGQIILGNHGLCTSGKGSDEALATTKMAVKAAKIRIGALSAGGLNFITIEAAEAIAFRPDEIARRLMLTTEKNDK